MRDCTLRGFDLDMSSFELEVLRQVCLDSDMSCLLVDRRFVIGSVIPLEVIERAFVHWIFVV